MQARTLTEIVKELEPLLRERLTSMRVTVDGGQAVATLSILLFGPPGAFGQAGPYQITANLDGLPAGVQAAGWERFPDQRRVVRMDVPISDQIAELDASGLVGGLDAARYQYNLSDANAAGVAALSWTIKTHAGSQQERTAWLMSIR